MEPLDPEASVPLYAQLKARIMAKVEDGRYPVGSRIPSEERLIEDFNVSRITVRRAVQELVREDILEKRQGKGTYVKRHEVQAKFTQDSEVCSFTAACEKAGMRPGARVDRVSLEPVPEGEHGFLGSDPSDRLLRIDRVRTADGVPIMVEENLFPAGRYGFLADVDLEDASLYEVIRDRLGTEPMLKEPCQLDLERASFRLASMLGVPCGEPLFLYAGRYFDSEGRPMYLGRQHIVGSRFSFRI